MAYNNRNYLKTVRYITEVYASVKQHDIPDTFIVKNEFPKRGINMSYRKWMMIKNMKQRGLQPQPTLFR